MILALLSWYYKDDDDYLDQCHVTNLILLPLLGSVQAGGSSAITWWVLIGFAFFLVFLLSKFRPGAWLSTLLLHFDYFRRGWNFWLFRCFNFLPNPRVEKTTLYDELDLTFVFLNACATQHQTLAIAFFPEKIPCTFFFTFFLQSTSQLSTVIVLVLKYREVILLPQILKWQSVNNDYRAVRVEVKCHLTILNSLSSKSRHLAKCCVTE